MNEWMDEWMNHLFVFSTITIMNDNELIDKRMKKEKHNTCYILVLHTISIVG